MQDRRPPALQNLLATHGRTIHSGQSRRSSYLGMSASPATSDVSLRCSEPTLRAGSGGRKPFIANWAPSLQNDCPIFRLTVGSAARQWAQGRGSTWTSPTQRLTDGKILAMGAVIQLRGRFAARTSKRLRTQPASYIGRTFTRRRRKAKLLRSATCFKSQARTRRPLRR